VFTSNPNEEIVNAVSTNTVSQTSPEVKVNHSVNYPEATATVIPFIKPEYSTLNGFMEMLFARSTEGVPCLVIDTGGGWPARPWHPSNQYPRETHWAISTVKPGGDGVSCQRRAKDCVRAVAIVLDDIGTAPKSIVDPSAIKLAPTFIMETSENNHQYAFKLWPHAEPERAAALVKVAIAARLSDVGAAGPNRVVRLPGSLKHGKTFPARLVMCDPERAYTLEELAAGLGLDMTAIDAATRNVSASAAGLRTLDEARSYEHTDPVLTGLDKLNMVRWNELQSGGYLGVDCPWGHTHSRQDGQTGYNPVTRHFNCFHSDNDGTTPGRTKTREDIVAWLAGALGADMAAKAKATFGEDVDAATKQQLGEQAWHEIKLKAAQETFRRVPLPDAGNDNATAADPETAALAASLAAAKAAAKEPYQIRLVPLGRGVGKLRPKMPADMCSIVTRQTVTIFVSPPGAGKSQLALSLAMALASDPATNPHKLIGDTQRFRLTGGTLFLSNEDAHIYAEGRREAWLARHKVGPETLVANVDANEVMDVKAITKAGKNAVVDIAAPLAAYGEYILRQRVLGNDYCLVVLDTAATVLENIDENASSDTAPAYQRLQRWAADHDVAVLLLHHTKKGKGVDQDAIRGSSAIAGSVRKSFILDPCTPKGRKKGREKYVRLKSLKANHDEEDFDGRIFHMVNERIAVEDPEDPTAPTSKTYPVLIYDDAATKGLTDVDADDRLFRGMAIICKAASNGEPYNPSTNGNAKNRLIDGLTEGLSINDDEAGALIAEYEKRGWIDMAGEVPDRTTRARPRKAVLPTEAGGRFVKERAARVFLDTPGEVAEEPPVDQTRTDLSEEPPVVLTRKARPPKPSGPLSAPAVGGILAGLGEIEFGTTAG
jgi:hypothetical protein